jgi:hypothetical protein
MGFSSIQKTASTGSSAIGALVGANSLQPGIVAFGLESRHWVSVMPPSDPEGDPGSGQGKLFVELGVITDTQYWLGLETWNKGLNLSPENIDPWNQGQTFTPAATYAPLGTSWLFCPLDGLCFFIRCQMGFIKVHYFSLLITIFSFFFGFFFVIFCFWTGPHTLATQLTFTSLPS